ncbi:MAG: TonB family protein [Fulvivirga sp.]
MKYILLLGLTLAINDSVTAQKTKKITVKSDYPLFKETFYVLKSDETVKNGEYKKEIRGSLLKKGNYQNNKRTGVWEYYNLNKELMHKINLDDSALVYEANPSREFDKSKYSRPLIILGGYQTLYQQIGHTLRYPAQARRMGIQGKITVKLIVDVDGKIKSSEVIEGLGGGLNAEAIRVFKLIDFETLPALNLEGKPVETEIELPITFKLG